MDGGGFFSGLTRGIAVGPKPFQLRLEASGPGARSWHLVSFCLPRDGTCGFSTTRHLKGTRNGSRSSYSWSYYLDVSAIAVILDILHDLLLDGAIYDDHFRISLRIILPGNSSQDVPVAGERLGHSTGVSCVVDNPQVTTVESFIGVQSRVVHVEQPVADGSEIVGIAGQEMPARKIDVAHLRIVFQCGRCVVLGFDRDRVKEEVFTHAILHRPIDTL